VHVSQICRNDAKDHYCIDRCHTEVHNCDAKGWHTKTKSLWQEKDMSPKRQHKMEVITAPQRYWIGKVERQRRRLRMTNLQGQAIMPGKTQRHRIRKVKPQRRPLRTTNLQGQATKTPI
jgi:hypothetical protein